MAVNTDSPKKKAFGSTQEHMATESEAIQNSECPSTSIGHALELLLSAVYLHKSASSTLSSLLLGNENDPHVEVSKPLPNANAQNSSSNEAGNVQNAAAVSGGKAGENQNGKEKEPVIPASDVWNRILTNPATRRPDATMKMFKKIIQEGLLDSILPYVVSSLNLSPDPSKTIFPMVESVLNKADSDTESKKTPSPEEKEKNKEPPKPARGAAKVKEDPVGKEGITIKETPPDDSSKSDSTDDVAPVANPSSDSINDNGPPIVIHVCDEAHGLRQDFTCSRDLLINHIGYFAEVTAGQRLEDVDISVHCDVSIFDWLLKWVKKQDCPSAKSPILEPKNAISILISADFLKMNPLADEVLKYIHDNANRILEAQVNVSSLTDSLLSKLSRLFTHWELESLRDPKDRLLNKLYARFVQMLCEAHPFPSKGIYRTASQIYRCSDCGKIISRSVEKFIDCTPSNTCVTVCGNVFYTHSRDVSWNLTDHVKFLKSEMRFWRWVYWRLWGQVHFLPCSTCGIVFPGSEMKLCRHHRLEPSFAMENFGPIISNGADTYPCCGARALRFSPLPLRNGCQFNEHTVQLTRRSNEVWGPIPQIYDDLLTFQLLICTEPRREESVGQKVIWKGVSLVSGLRSEKSFLDRSWLAEHRVEKGTTTVDERDPLNDAASPKVEEVPEISEEIFQKPVSDCESESSDDEEEGTKKKGRRRTLPPRMKTMLLRKAAKAKRTVAYEMANEPGWKWDTTRSTRYNQDAQRDRELKVFRELTAWLALPLPAVSDVTVGNSMKNRYKIDRNKKDGTIPGPDPGSYYRLELEFKEKFGNHDKSHGLNQAGGAFRAKVQAISRIKMRLRHRAAFSATR